MEQEQLSPSCDQETFARVWRRVMPEDRADCPFVLPAALPAPDPSGREEPGPARPCLEPASAGSGARLQQYIDRALAGWRSYRALARRIPGAPGRRLAALAEGERRLARRLSAAYFLLSGVRYWPAGGPDRPSPLPADAALRERFLEERRLSAASRAAAEGCGDPCLGALFQELAAGAEDRARAVWEVVEAL